MGTLSDITKLELRKKRDASARCVTMRTEQSQKWTQSTALYIFRTPRSAMTPSQDIQIVSDVRGSSALLGHFVAEVKNRSPFGMASSESWESLLEIAIECGDAISIHTDPRWNGSFFNLRRVRAMTTKPLLAKGIHATDDEVRLALDCGADAVLVVGRIPALDLLPKCWLEPLTIAELKTLPPCVAVWNARDLRDGARKTETWEEARMAWTGTLCQASLICQPSDIKPDADCFIVGERMKDLARALRPNAAHEPQRKGGTDAN